MITLVTLVTNVLYFTVLCFTLKLVNITSVVLQVM